MGRTVSFTELDIIEACNQLELDGKKINGTNLRLQIGSGSPKSLHSAFISLLAKGRIKLKSDSRIEGLEVQLEAQLESLHQQEEINKVLTSSLELLITSAMDSADYIEGVVDDSWPLNPFETMTIKLNEGIKDLGLSYQDIHESGLLTYKKYLAEKQIALLTLSITENSDSELCEFKRNLIAAEFANEANANVNYDDVITQLKNKIEVRAAHLKNLKKIENIERNKIIENKILEKDKNIRTKEEETFLSKLAQCGHEMEESLEFILLSQKLCK